jgi:NAD(P)-dependent dehydrogenase (short-subunit alcohol dehydrogenase family)
MSQDLSGKVAIVTGAGSEKGIGAAIAFGFIRAGAKVAFVDLEPASLERNVDQARAIGGTGCAIGIVADVSDVTSVEHAVGRTLAGLGGLHVLVNNAGVLPSMLTPETAGDPLAVRTWEVPPEIWARVVAINFNGAYHFVRAATPHFLKQGWGRIIGITTSLDTMYTMGQPPYGPSKAAHEAMISVLAKELAGSGVTANVVTPGGLTNTNQVRVTTKAYGFSPADMLQPDAMAAPCVWLASAEADTFTDRRIVARFWDKALPLAARVANASAPAAWQQLGAQAKVPATRK